MKSIVFITPHLSTGGCPQYLLKKIELLKETYEIYVIEYAYVAPAFVVQRNKVISHCENRFYSLGDDKSELLRIVNHICPDIIHIEEIPEYFMDSTVTDSLYTKERTYKIFETSHDSSVNIQSKRYLPDGFLLVSQYQINQFESLGIPCKLIEYPIDYKETRNKEAAQAKLGFDPTLKHVINVGLFTSRKNQAEIIEYAKKLKGQPIQFHFIGNQADNFRYYWEPLMQDFPENCKWWGERDDVDTFYEAADLFLFTSRGHENDKETMPLVIREAISWKVPSLIYDLSVYLSYFDKFETIDYLNFEDLDENAELILKKLGISVNEYKDCVIISAYPTTRDSIELTKRSIIAAKTAGLPVILAAHCPVPKEITELCTATTIDDNNILTFHDYYSQYWNSTDSFNVRINIRENGNHIYHGPAVYTNYRNGVKLAKELGYNRCILTNFDFILSNSSISRMFEKLDGRSAVFHHELKSEGHSLTTAFCAVNSKFFIDCFPEIRSELDYINWKNDVCSESNGLENMFFHTLRKFNSSYLEISDDEYRNILSSSKYDSCSQVEYFTFLEVENDPNKFAVWYNISDKIINTRVYIVILGSKIEIHEINENIFYRILEKNEKISAFLIKDGTEVRRIFTNSFDFTNNGTLLLK